MDRALEITADFWETNASQLLLNPRYDSLEKKQLMDAVNHWDQKDLVWLRSSGTESTGKGIKLVGLQKSAILAAAQSVNQFYNLDKNDVWLNSLPIFHIGGLSIYARAFLSRSSVNEMDQWSVESFINSIKNNLITVCSLVPTQIFDLVKDKVKAPASLRLVIVGGGALLPDLYKSARELDWPIALSYGMTETSAMIAGTPLDQIKSKEFPEMELLPHVKLSSIEEKWVCRSESLFDGYLWVNGNQAEYQPRPEPFVLDDRLVLEGKKLKILGRESEIIKILGETVNLNLLTEKLSKVLTGNFFIYPEQEERRGYNLTLFIEGEKSRLDLDSINGDLMPFEKISSFKFIRSFVRTSLGKINKLETVRQNYFQV